MEVDRSGHARGPRLARAEEAPLAALALLRRPAREERLDVVVEDLAAELEVVRGEVGVVRRDQHVLEVPQRRPSMEQAR